MKAIVEEQLEQFGVVGAAVAVLHGDDVLLADGFGVADVETQEPVSAQTAFCIGSTTKAFTSALVSGLVDEGVLSWDRPVREYLDGFAMSDPFTTDRLTVRDMLSHRSGLPRHDLMWYGNDALTRADLVARLRHLEPTADLRTLYQYNNLLYITAGHLCESVTGQSWEQLVQSRLLDPLGMSGTTFSPDDCAIVSAAHVTRDGLTTRAGYARGTALAGPAGSLCAPIGDLLPWMRLHLGELAHAAPVSPAGIREVLTPQVVMREQGPFPEQREWAYGLGWVVGTYRGQTHVHHSGTVDGFTALISLIPERRLGIAVVANVHGNPLPWSLAYTLTDRVLGVDDPGWASRFAAVHQALQQPTAGADGRQDVTAVELPPECYGTYAHPGYGELVLARTPAGPVAQLHGVELAVTPQSDDVVRLCHAFHRRDMPGAFHRNQTGEVTALALAVEPELPPVHFSRDKG